MTQKEVSEQSGITIMNIHKFENVVKATATYWPDEQPDSELNVMTLIAGHKFDLIINIPKNHTNRELTNGYKIRRGAIDHNIPLITTSRFIDS